MYPKILAFPWLGPCQDIQALLEWASRQSHDPLGLPAARSIAGIEYRIDCIRFIIVRTNISTQFTSTSTCTSTGRVRCISSGGFGKLDTCFINVALINYDTA